MLDIDIEQTLVGVLGHFTMYQTNVDVVEVENTEFRQQEFYPTLGNHTLCLVYPNGDVVVVSHPPRHLRRVAFDVGGQD